MAKAMTLGVEDAVTLATTCTNLTGATTATVLELWESDQDVYVVTGDVADGAALPATGRPKVPTSAMPCVLDISGYGQISLAAGAAGTCRAILR